MKLPLAEKAREMYEWQESSQTTDGQIEPVIEERRWRDLNQRKTGCG
jgi:hypothetical protein